jgi:hypothetical protein
MRRGTLVALVLTAALLTVPGAGAAAADPANDHTLAITLACDGGRTVDAVFELSSADAFHLVDIESNFLWKSLSFLDAASGQTVTITRGVQGGGHDLVTCTYTGPVSGNHYTVEGFFTPAA